MSRNTPKRRWLQFSLRGVLVLTLAVALWLGYEVHQARRVEQTVAALQELDGNAECELTGWSLLRLCRVPGYGRQIVRVDIPGSAAEQVIELLRGSSGLREVQVTYDGTFDPAPSWKALLGSLPNVSVSPAAEEASDCESRIASKALETYSAADVKCLFQETRRIRAWHGELIPTRHYRIVRLPDDSLAEILIGSEMLDVINATFFAVLVVDDRCVGIRGFFTPYDMPLGTLLEDIDGDEAAELGFEWTDKLTKHSYMRQLRGDSRDWLGVYKIERDGFKSLLPEDMSDLPEGSSLNRERRIEWRTSPNLTAPDVPESRIEPPTDAESALPPPRPPASSRSLLPDSGR
jgi:hypothetical protein